MNYDGFLKLVQSRRSIRRFKPDPVPEEYVDKIIEAARWAPSGANSQPWEFIVVKKQETKDSIVKICEENTEHTCRMELTREPELRYSALTKPRTLPPGFATAPVFIVLCGDPRTKETYPLRAILNRGQSIFISSLASAYLCMALAATALGLGSQWVTATSNPFEQSLIKQLLGIPPELEIYDTMAVGYPATEPKPRLVRAREEMVNYEYYDKAKFRTEQQVKGFIVSLRRGGTRG